MALRPRLWPGVPLSDRSQIQCGAVPVKTVPTMSSPPATPEAGQRVIHLRLQRPAALGNRAGRMSGYGVYQAYDGRAAAELCRYMSAIGLLVLNTEGTGLDTGRLIATVREIHPGLPVLHIGASTPPDLPADVPTLADNFTPDHRLMTVAALVGHA